MNAQAGQPQRGGVLRIGNTYVPPPRMGVPGRINVGGPWLEPVIDHLLRVDKEGHLVPHLIESWEYSKDGLQLTLNARKGVKFHDGTDFNAAAVKWNLTDANGELTLSTARLKSRCGGADAPSTTSMPSGRNRSARASGRSFGSSSCLRRSTQVRSRSSSGAPAGAARPG